MHLLKNFTSTIIILILICLNTISFNVIVSNILFTLFYVFIYLLYTNNYLSIIVVVLLGIIFDSVNGINLGVSSLILVITYIIYLLQNNKLLNSVLFRYSLAIINSLIILIYMKLMGLILTVPFINAIRFFIIALIEISIFLPILLIIKNSFFNNAK